MGQLEHLARERITKWRKQHKVSQARLGQVTGHHQTTVGKWEQGDGTLDVDTLAAWARFFGRTLFDLFAHEDLPMANNADFVAAYNALPTDELREKILHLMTALKTDRGPGERGTPPAPKRGAKRG